jgi:hypothetical protein
MVGCQSLKLWFIEIRNKFRKLLKTYFFVWSGGSSIGSDNIGKFSF